MRHRKIIPLALAGLLVLSTGAWPEPPDDPESRDVWLDRFNAGKRAHEARRFEKAVKHFEAALETTEGFADGDPRIGSSLEWLAASLMDLERWTDAEPHLRRLTRLPGTEPSHVDWRRNAHRDLALVLRLSGRLDEAKTEQQRYMKVLGWKAESVLRCEAIESLAWIEIDRGADPHALRLLRMALRIRERIGEGTAMATVLHQVGMIHWRLDRMSEAVPFFERALAIRTKLLPPDDPDLARSIDAAAMVDLHKGHYHAALVKVSKALEVLEKAPGPRSGNLAGALQTLASAHAQLGQFEEAERAARRALELKRKAHGPEHRQVGFVYMLLANVLQGRGKLAEALEFRILARKISRAKGTGNEADEAAADHCIGTLYRDLGRFDKADLSFRRAIEGMEQSLGKEHPYLAYPLTGLAMVQRALGRLDEAEALCRRAVAIRLKALGPEHPSLIFSYTILAQVIRDAGRLPEAESTARKALAMAKGPGRDPAELGLVSGVVASILQRRGVATDALAMFTKALAMQEKALGSEHHQLLPTLDEHAIALRAAGQEEAASKLTLRAAAIRKKLAAVPDR